MDMVLMSNYTLAAVATVLYAALCIYCLYLRKPTLQSANVNAGALPSCNTGECERSVLIAYASQSGNAASLALSQAKTLQGQCHVQLSQLNTVTHDALKSVRLALFVVSTYGEGEPPDNAVRFLKQLRSHPPDGTQLDISFAVLALGDRSYRQFCAFGLMLHQLLEQHGATPLFEPVCVNQLSEQDLAFWQQQLGNQSTLQDLQALQTAALAPDSGKHYEKWYVSSRRCINNGSPGNPIYHLRLISYAAQPMQWQAGDIANVIIGGHDEDVFEHREYSIASIPEDGSLDLVIRQLIKEDGSLGMGSGWLTEELPAGGAVTLQIRHNSAFHGPPGNVPMILIGNGTGIAGLRSHLRAREQQGARRNWLLFGERSRAYDFHFSSQLLSWQSHGYLEHLNLAFSRESERIVYVQHLLEEYAPRLRDWVFGGAAIYLCGSLQGMAQDVDGTLRRLLGEEKVDELLEQGLYRRDVY